MDGHETRKNATHVNTICRRGEYNGVYKHIRLFSTRRHKPNVVIYHYNYIALRISV